jgi:hypothetical protein
MSGHAERTRPGIRAATRADASLAKDHASRAVPVDRDDARPSPRETTPAAATRATIAPGVARPHAGTRRALPQHEAHPRHEGRSRQSVELRRMVLARAWHAGMMGRTTSGRPAWLTIDPSLASWRPGRGSPSRSATDVPMNKDSWATRSRVFRRRRKIAPATAERRLSWRNPHPVRGAGPR